MPCACTSRAPCATAVKRSVCISSVRNVLPRCLAESLFASGQVNSTVPSKPRYPTGTTSWSWRSQSGGLKSRLGVPGPPTRPRPALLGSDLSPRCGRRAARSVAQRDPASSQGRSAWRTGRRTWLCCLAAGIGKPPEASGLRLGLCPERRLQADRCDRTLPAATLHTRVSLPVLSISVSSWSLCIRLLA